MYGQDDDNQQQNGQDWQQPADQAQQAQAPVNDFAQDSSLEAPAVQTFGPTPATDPVAAPVQNDWQQPSAAAPVAPAEPTVPDWSAPTTPTVDEPATQTDTPAPSGDLMDIKQKALTELSPLVSQLDQTPEEKFKTTMMMIQASDNQSLIAEAYDAAQSITDEKVKAQALLDIVNEINYFTQHQS